MFERQQVGKSVQFRVQPFPVTFARVAFADAAVFRSRLYAEIHNTTLTVNSNSGNQFNDSIGTLSFTVVEFFLVDAPIEIYYTRETSSIFIHCYNKLNRNNFDEP